MQVRLALSTPACSSMRAGPALPASFRSNTTSPCHSRAALNPSPISDSRFCLRAIMSASLCAGRRRQVQHGASRMRSLTAWFRQLQQTCGHGADVREHRHQSRRGSGARATLL
eukprot:716793-Rhodomonas_salina.1